MRILRIKSFSKKDKKKRNDNEKLFPGQKIVGVGGIAAGGKLLDNVHKSGEISGRVHLYHGTSKEAAENIKKEGLKKSHAIGFDTITYEAGIPQEELVFTAKKRRVAAGHALPHLVEGGMALKLFV